LRASGRRHHGQASSIEAERERVAQAGVERRRGGRQWRVVRAGGGNPGSPEAVIGKARNPRPDAAAHRLRRGARLPVHHTKQTREKTWKRLQIERAGG
jgi:hypothetical protein